MAGRFLKSLSSLYARRPILCNVCMYGTLYSTADLTQQTILKKPKYNFENAGRMATVGGTFFGPFYFIWYRALDRMLPGTAVRTIIKKVVLDQGVAGIMGLSVFFTYLSILEGKENVFAELIDKGPKTYMVACIYWPAVQAINFLVLPPHLRTVFVGVNAFCWTNALAYIKSLQSGEDFKLI